MINFLKYRFVYFAISLFVLVPGILSLVVWGLKPSIDFSGGTVIEFTNYKGEQKIIEDAFSQKNIATSTIQKENETVLIKTKPINREEWEEIKLILDKEATHSATPSGSLTANNQIEATQSGGLVETRFESVGPILGMELLKKTLIAAVIAIVCILLYIAWAFRDIHYGVSAIIALIHDLLVVIGVFSLLGHFVGVEVDLLFVTAVLTTMSFSVHDTIVVSDRIRESLRKESLSLEDTVNKSLTETMTRSLNNSMTIVFMLVALVLLGGETIRWFTVALLIGTVSGTYSSPFVATQILYILKKRKR